MPILWGYATWRVLTVVLRNLIQPVNKRKCTRATLGVLHFVRNKYLYSWVYVSGNAIASLLR